MKLRSIILSSALVAVLAACASSPSATDPSASATSGAGASTDFPNVTVEGGVGEDPKISFDAKVEPPAELKTKDLVEGDGETVQAGATVTVFYKGVSWKNDGQVFDGNFGADPVTFPLNQVIPGWRDGLVGQKVNGRRLLVIPPDQAYGDQAIPPAIAANDTLVFVVDVVGVQNP